MKIWQCKIGEVEQTAIRGRPFPHSADQFMRDAVAGAYQQLTGREDTFLFSGWGGRLTEGERAAVEDRLPVPPDEYLVVSLRALCEQWGPWVVADTARWIAAAAAEGES